MIIVFDLDDTLYVELEYVKSGFQAVSSFLEQRFGLASEETFGAMMDILESHGRGAVFDRLSQLPEIEKIQKSDIVVKNNGSIETMIMYGKLFSRLPEYNKEVSSG